MQFKLDNDNFNSCFKRRDAEYIIDSAAIIETLARILPELDGGYVDEMDRWKLCILLPNLLDRLGIVIDEGNICH